MGARTSEGRSEFRDSFDCAPLGEINRGSAKGRGARVQERSMSLVRRGITARFATPFSRFPGFLFDHRESWVRIPDRSAGFPEGTRSCGFGFDGSCRVGTVLA